MDSGLDGIASRDAARRRRGLLIYSETVRILSTQFTVSSNSGELIERLAYLVQRAQQELPLAERCSIDVICADGEYRIVGGDGPDECVPSLGATFDALFARLHDRALGQFSDHIRIHAASGYGPKGMVLLVGEKWSGKTTASAHLLLEGCEMVGDELVLLKHGCAITFPRPFYLRHSAIALLPKLAGATNGAPFVNAEVGGKLFAIDPLKLKRSWRIREARLQTVILLEPNHGGTTTITPCGKLEMTRRVLGQSSPPASGRSDWLADFCTAINGAETYVASMGDLPSATALFRPFFTLHV